MEHCLGSGVAWGQPCLEARAGDPQDPWWFQARDTAEAVEVQHGGSDTHPMHPGQQQSPRMTIFQMREDAFVTRLQIH